LNPKFASELAATLCELRVRGNSDDEAIQEPWCVIPGFLRSARNDVFPNDITIAPKVV
jgi:hypothetical protein